MFCDRLLGPRARPRYANVDGRAAGIAIVTCGALTERAGVRDHVLGGVRPRGGMENHANGLSCGRPVDANKGTRHSISLSSAPQLRTPSSALSVCASAI